MGDNLGLNLQLIDWSTHPEVIMSPYKNETLGWEVTKFHCLFGDIQMKLEENERGNTSRLMKTKEMLAKEAE